MAIQILTPEARAYFGPKCCGGGEETSCSGIRFYGMTLQFFGKCIHFFNYTG